MPIDLDGIIVSWRKARTEGTRIAKLAQDAKEAYTDADGNRQPPHADTVADIKAQAAILVPAFEAALLEMKTAYTL